MFKKVNSVILAKKKGLKKGQFLKIDKNGCYVPILHPQISLHDNFQFPKNSAILGYF